MTPRVAVVHDYLTQRGGAERVVLSMMRCFPTATLHTTVYNPSTTYAEFANYDVRTSVLNRVAPFRRDPRMALFLLPRAITSLDIDGADVILTSTSGWAHGVVSPVPVVAYCHTPARWLYEPSDYFHGTSPLLSGAFRCVSPYLRRWDARAARRVDTYVANSSVVARRIERVYGIRPAVVFPPTTLSEDGPRTPVPGLEPGFLLTIGRQRGYKRTAEVREAVERHTMQRLVIVGEDPATARESGGSGRVTALPAVSDAQLRWLYASCRALVAASAEDFGLTPVEAFLFGRPVVALAAGGYLDSCVDGVTGALVDRPDPASIAVGIERVVSQVWDEDRIRAHGATFRIDRFGAAITEVLDAALASHAPDWAGRRAS